MNNTISYKNIIMDINSGATQWRIWSALAWNAIKMEYRRTVFGPIWISLQHAIFIVTLGYIFGSIQNSADPSFFVYFATGYTFWLLISNFVTNAGNTFKGINGLPHMTKAALSNHIYLQFTSQILLFAHQSIPLVVMLSIYHAAVTIHLPLLLCGITSLLIFGFWVSALIGCLSLRFQDLVPAITSVMQVLFFTTPIMFRSARIPGASDFSIYNPFFHLLVVVRANIVSEDIFLINWISVVIFNVTGIIVTICVLKWARPKLAFWVG